MPANATRTVQDAFKPMVDYSESLIAARAAIRAAEDYANAGDWLRFTHACERGCLALIRAEQYGDGRLRETHVGMADRSFLLDNAPAVLAVLRAAWAHEQGLAQLDPAAEGDDEEHFVNALEHADDTAEALAAAVAALGELPS